MKGKGVDYVAVRARLNAGERVKDIAASYGVTPSAISQAARRRGWLGFVGKTKRPFARQQGEASA